MRPFHASGAALAAACFLLSALPAFANETGTVNARVVVASPCITVAILNNAPSLDFGTHAFSLLGSPTSAGDTSTLLKNCGNGAQSISVKGTDAGLSGGASWALQTDLDVCAQGTNKYAIRLRARHLPGAQVYPNADIVLEKTNKPLYTQPAEAVDDYAETMLFMPCTGSDGAGQTAAFQLTYTASL